jgi:hypothetical protein
VRGSYHVRRIEELNNRLDGQIGAGRWQSIEHHGLGCYKLLQLGHRGTQSLDASVKYGMAMMPSWSPATGGGDEKNT